VIWVLSTRGTLQGLFWCPSRLRVICVTPGGCPDTEVTSRAVRTEQGSRFQVGYRRDGLGVGCHLGSSGRRWTQGLAPAAPPCVSSALLRRFREVDADGAPAGAGRGARGRGEGRGARPGGQPGERGLRGTGLGAREGRRRSAEPGPWAAGRPEPAFGLRQAARGTGRRGPEVSRPLGRLLPGAEPAGRWARGRVCEDAEGRGEGAGTGGAAPRVSLGGTVDRPSGSPGPAASAAA
jgi:hypothetical protein